MEVWRPAKAIANVQLGELLTHGLCPIKQRTNATKKKRTFAAGPERSGRNQRTGLLQNDTSSADKAITAIRHNLLIETQETSYCSGTSKQSLSKLSNPSEQNGLCNSTATIHWCQHFCIHCFHCCFLSVFF